jgi:hypothetical protein
MGIVGLGIFFVSVFLLLFAWFSRQESQREPGRDVALPADIPQAAAPFDNGDDEGTAKQIAAIDARTRFLFDFARVAVLRERFFELRNAYVDLAGRLGAPRYRADEAERQNPNLATCARANLD